MLILIHKLSLFIAEFIMRSSKILTGIVVFLGFTFMGYQCSSTELTSAKLYIQQKNYDKAIESLEKEVQKNPQSDEGYYLLGYVYGEKGQYEQMVDEFDKSLSISKNFEEEIVASRKYYWVNLYNKGVKAYQKGVESQNEDSSKIFLDKAADVFETAIKVEPDSTDTYQNLAFVYMNKGDYDKAIDPLESLIELTKPKVNNDIMGIAEAELINKYGKPNSIVVSKYKNIDATIYVYNSINADIYLDNDKVIGFTAVKDGDKSALDGYRYLGEILYERGVKQQSEEDSTAAMQTFDEAIKVLEEGRKYYPNNQDILLALSNSYIAANKLDVAMDVFKAGVEAEPENQYYRYNYGVLLLGAKQYEEAEKQFLKAIEIDPNYENALYNLGVTYIYWGTHLNKLAEEKGETSSEYREKYQMALPYMEKVVEMKPDDATVWELLGRVYTVLGMQDDATNAFNKADQLRQ
jgi:tetratricopeptide (TPR) repeat protein